MKNAVLIALVVLVILFVVYQYDPSFFGLFVSEGFENVTKAGGAVPSGSAHGNLKAGQMAANGKAQKDQNAGAGAGFQKSKIGLDFPAGFHHPEGQPACILVCLPDLELFKQYRRQMYFGVVGFGAGVVQEFACRAVEIESSGSLIDDDNAGLHALNDLLVYFLQ